MRTLQDLNNRRGGRIGASAGPLAVSRNFEDIRSRVERGETSMPGRGMLCSCGGVFQKMAVLHDGTMVPCNLLPGLKMGRIGETPLQEAWLRSPAINAVRYRRKVPLSSLPECQGCPYTGFCAGGCPGVVYSQTGRLEGVDPLVCYRLFKEHYSVQGAL